MLVPEDELARRRASSVPPRLDNQTPWQEFFRAHVGQLETGACLEFAVAYRNIDETKGIPRDSH